MSGKKIQINFVLFGKNNRKYLKDVKAISWELLHRLVVTDIDTRKLKKVVKNEQTVKRRVWKLKENHLKAIFQKRVKKLVNVDAPYLWNTFKNGLLKAREEAFEKKKGWRNHGICAAGIKR